jgi:hypothetical protein
MSDQVGLLEQHVMLAVSAHEAGVHTRPSICFPTNCHCTLGVGRRQRSPTRVSGLLPLTVFCGLPSDRLYLESPCTSLTTACLWGFLVSGTHPLLQNIKLPSKLEFVVVVPTSQIFADAPRRGRAPRSL